MLNLAVRFVLELCMLGAVAYWGFKTQPTWLMKIVLGVGLPLLMAVLWGTFLAPKATRPLRGASFHALELFLFAAGAAALFASGQPALGWLYTVVLAANKISLTLWKH